MKITEVRVTNFRGLAELEFEPGSGLNVIAGPNGVGKSSLLEALRLYKAFLIGRYQEEIRQVLVSLGASSPSVPWGPLQIDVANLAGDPGSQIQISVQFVLSQGEFDLLKAKNQDLGLNLIRSRMGQGRDNAQLELVQFLSSPAGKAQLADATQTVVDFISTVESTKRLSSVLTIDPKTGQIYGSDQMAQLLIASLEATASPGQAMFSYFPADRAMPTGEVNIQIGSADMKAQAESHLGNAPTKYHRLKQSIINQLVLVNFSADTVKKHFNEVIGALLPGKSLEAFNQKPNGNLSVVIRESGKNRLFDIDSLSSGEKGVLLTYYLLKTTLARGGIVFLDEPELHLNPAVCQRIVPYLVSDVLDPMDVQAFVCTHSPEVIGAAFERPTCRLFHLRSERDISPVLRSDQFEVFEILRRLGASTADVLSSKGAVFVEGDQDTRILSAQYFDCLQGFKVSELGGRDGVIKEVKELQRTEREGKLKKLNVFIFDHDNRPENIASTTYVRVVQLDRYCIENYLIDENALFDALTKHAGLVPESRGTFSADLKQMALAQLPELAAKIEYASEEPENCGLIARELRGLSCPAIASKLADRLQRVSLSLATFNRSVWEPAFTGKLEATCAGLRSEWDLNWRSKCSGKRLFRDLQERYRIKLSPAAFKELMIQTLAAGKSETWRLLESIVGDAISAVP